jgi:hypothetical protein
MTNLGASKDVSVSFEAEWIANSTKQTGWRNFGFQLHELLKVQLGDLN